MSKRPQDNVVTDLAVDNKELQQALIDTQKESEGYKRAWDAEKATSALYKEQLAKANTKHDFHLGMAVGGVLGAAIGVATVVICIL